MIPSDHPHPPAPARGETTDPKDWITVRLAWGAVKVFQIDRKLDEHVSPSVASRIRVHPQRGSRCVMVTGAPDDLAALARSFAMYDTGAYTPLARRTGHNLWARIDAALRSPSPPERRAVSERNGATFSNCKTYRYALWRKWVDSPLPRTFVVIGLNPSTADETQDDPTIRRCIGFAKREGCGKLVMLNLFALRATDPSVMLHHPDPVGAGNDAVIDVYATRAGAAAPEKRDIVVAAWGAHGSHLNRAMEVRAILAKHGVPLYCFGRTKAGAPKHPLYLKGDTPLVPYE